MNIYKKDWRGRLFVFVLLPAAIFASTSPLIGHPRQSETNVQGLAFQERNPRYRVHVGDVMDLSFPFTPEFNQTVTVQPDGYINLRGVGDVQVQDKTTPEVVDIVRAAYNNVLRDPAVTVELKDFEKPYFVVGGEVVHPGKFDLRGETTVTQALSIAGGFNDRAKNSEVLLFRRVSDKLVEVKKVDVKRMLAAKDLSEDLHLRPGDMILIPKTKFATISRFIPIPTLGMYFNPIHY
ncbi:MAG TPA: polysaccharide biosynthesis/export family protein [Terriglobia bacterium]|nr:polysaccharide biosynthesis/export family protein [Terriglobia bacterium]